LERRFLSSEHKSVCSRSSEIIVFAATLAQNPTVAEYNLDVSLRSQYAKKILDKNHTGLISIQQIAKAPVLRKPDIGGYDDVNRATGVRVR